MNIDARKIYLKHTIIMAVTCMTFIGMQATEI